MSGHRPPVLWLNGRQLTSTGRDRAPVLAPCRLVWGSDSPTDQPKPDTLTFTVLFRDGMHDIPDLVNGAEIELVHDTVTTVFAGTIRDMEAELSERKKGALEVRCNAVGHIRALDDEFLATDWPAGTDRPAQLAAAFTAAGWQLELPTTPQPSAKATYNSIKLLTMLDRYSMRYHGRRYETSWRDNGILRRRLAVMPATERSAPADELLGLPGAVWDRTYNVPMHDGVESPLLLLPARNVLTNPSWTQRAENTITAVRLGTMQQGDDGFTELADPVIHQAPAELRQRYGNTSVDVDTDLTDAGDQAQAAAAWMNDDSPWNMSGLNVRDSHQLTAEELDALLDPERRSHTLVAVTGVMPNRPDPGPSVMRSYLLAGDYTWTGKKWELTLALERTIYARPTAGVTFEQVAQSFDPNIYGGSFDSIGPALSFADFREIEALQAAAGEFWTYELMALEPTQYSFDTFNPELTFADFLTIRRA